MAESNMSSVAQTTARERALWQRQIGSVPSLLGGKNAWVSILFELIKQIGEAGVDNLDAKPLLMETLQAAGRRSGGASPRIEPAKWAEYVPFLRTMRLVENGPDGLHLSDKGRDLLSNLDVRLLAEIFADRIRLFSETLAFISVEPVTVDSVAQWLRDSYQTSWKGASSARNRMDWQEALGLIEPAGERRWRITSDGASLMSNRLLVSPSALEVQADIEVAIAPPPIEVAALLEDLSQGTRSADARSTYNVWVPSPAANSNKVENLRTITNAALHRIEKEELFGFICSTFNLRRSSVDSMLPFLRAAGLLVEVGRGVFEATPPARAWVESGDDLNFIRILHANYRFVGEMVDCVRDEVTRQLMYASAARYGLNVDKSRWIASFLLDTGMIEEPRYGSLRATSLGLALLSELPAALPPSDENVPNQREKAGSIQDNGPADPPARFDLTRLAREPNADGKGSGRAFEDAVRRAFAYMGFDARLISGSGDTDVLVSWTDVNGSRMTAVVEAKVRSNGQVVHTDISDVALETHKARHHADFVAVIGPSFVGDTIANIAVARSWVLLEAERLDALAMSAVALGLRPYEIAAVFRAEGGMADVSELIAQRERELGIVTFAVRKLLDEQVESAEPLSARDISRDGRKSELAPTVDEVISAINLVSQMSTDCLRLVEQSDDPKYSTYLLGNVIATARQLRALAAALEAPLLESPNGRP